MQLEKKTKNPVEAKYNPADLRRLIDNCIEGQQYAWDVFFDIFTNNIKKYIRKSFISVHKDELAADSDTVRQVYLAVAKKLYADNGLAHIEEEEKRGHIGVILAWLKKTSYRKVMDFLSQEKAQKRLSASQAGHVTIPLDKNLDDENGNKGATGHDIIGIGPNICDGDTKPTIDQLFAKAKKILRLDEWWILRLKLIFADPLSPEEINELAVFSNQDVSVTTKKINQLMDIMADRQAQEEKKLDNFGRMLSVIHHYQYILSQKTIENSSGTLKQQDIEGKILQINNRIKRQQATLDLPLTTTNRDIVEILGPEHADHTAVKWHRLKNKLKGILTLQ